MAHEPLRTSYINGLSSIGEYHPTSDISKSQRLSENMLSECATPIIVPPCPNKTSERCPIVIEENSILRLPNRIQASSQQMMRSITAKSSSDYALFDQSIAEKGSRTAPHKKEEPIPFTHALEDQHAPILPSVSDSVEKEARKDTKSSEEVIEQIKIITRCDFVNILPSGEILVLPPGWSCRESKTYAGHKYFVSPVGRTQWIRPSVKTGFGYDFVHEIEVTFGVGRLGLNLKHIAPEPGVDFSDLVVYIADFYKLRSGMASPAELYNWSMKPEKRLCIGMRMTAIDTTPLNGFTYAEVLEKLSSAPRPVRIKFAAVEKGIVGRVNLEIPREITEIEAKKRKAMEKQQNLRLQYLEISVFSDIQIQIWLIQRGMMRRQLSLLKNKTCVMSKKHEQLQIAHQSLLTEQQELSNEDIRLKEYIAHLELQKEEKAESAEAIKGVALNDRHMSLSKDIDEALLENNELRDLQQKLKTEHNKLQTELDVFGKLASENQNHFSLEEFGVLGLDNSSDTNRNRLITDSEIATESILQAKMEMEKQIAKESAQIQRMQLENLQFKKKLAATQVAERVDEEIISGLKPIQLIIAEKKVDKLRIELHDTVAALAKTSRDSQDPTLMNELSSRRKVLRMELQSALDETLALKQTYGTATETVIEDRNRRSTRCSSIESFAIDDDAPDDTHTSTSELITPRSIASLEDSPRIHEDSQTVLMQDKLLELRADLHDTVKKLAKANHDRATTGVLELSQRRMYLKQEMRSLEDAYHKRKSSFVSPSVPTKGRSASVSGTMLSIPSPMRRAPGVQSSSIPYEQEQEDSVAKSDESSFISQRVKPPRSIEKRRRFSLIRPKVSKADDSMDRERQILAMETLREAKARLVAQMDEINTRLAKTTSTQSAHKVLTLERTRLEKDLGQLAEQLDEHCVLLATEMPDSSHSGHVSMSSAMSRRGVEFPTKIDTLSAIAIVNKTGMLMKYPRRAQEKGIFGNLSVRGAQERYCEIDSNGVLKYYKLEGNSEPRGTFPLGDPSFEVVFDTISKKSHMFTIASTTQQIRFLARNQEEMLDWVRALKLTNQYLTQAKLHQTEQVMDRSTSQRDELRQTLDF